MEESKSFKRVKYSEQMIKEYLGEEWNFKFRKMRRTHGRCNHSKKVITLNLKLIIEGMDYFFDSVLFHEISHALAYPNCGHCFREFNIVSGGKSHML